MPLTTASWWLNSRWLLSCLVVESRDVNICHFYLQHRHHFVTNKILSRYLLSIEYTNELYFKDSGQMRRVKRSTTPFCSAATWCRWAGRLPGGGAPAWGWGSAWAWPAPACGGAGPRRPWWRSSTRTCSWAPGRRCAAWRRPTPSWRRACSADTETPCSSKSGAAYFQHDRVLLSHSQVLIVRNH